MYLFFKNSEYSFEPIDMLEIKLRHLLVISTGDIFFSGISPISVLSLLRYKFLVFSASSSKLDAPFVNQIFFFLPFLSVVVICLPSQYL